MLVESVGQPVPRDRGHGVQDPHQVTLTWTEPTPLPPTFMHLPATFPQLLQEDVYIKERSSGRMVQEAFEVRRETEQREALLVGMACRWWVTPSRGGELAVLGNDYRIQGTAPPTR